MLKNEIPQAVNIPKHICNKPYNTADTKKYEIIQAVNHSIHMGSFTKYVRAEVGRTGSRNTYDLVREKVGGGGVIQRSIRTYRTNDFFYYKTDLPSFYYSKRIQLTLFWNEQKFKLPHTA